MESAEGLEIGQFRGPWRITMWWPEGAVSGGPQKIVIEAEEDAPPGDVARGISTTVLRRLDLAGAVERARELAPTTPPWQAERGRLLDLVRLAARLLTDEGVSPRYLSVLCLTYRDLTDKGVQAPVPWLAEHLDRRSETVKDHLKKARRDGYLTSRAGRAGGALGDRAAEVLATLDGVPPAAAP
ncbi:hypothetical protein ACQPZG_07615 [Streptomyces sp. CA-294286]|uniref:hypothetical protein n=1 Tax=Streptomyces sp. CA-294286 TaxID=3240070 RepID=UPI003D8AA2C1